ncbi:hypothetical protein [Streptomyces sp. DSM 41921]|uniref:Uncharacterized protein n=1 Tax=Streptomyces dubilierae TaxID=3075533 RepID=A0ABU2PGS6_9ACTN|nr:hypothetical protein [Streptomyces sp. DSM 41921]MDT0390530.1 hypothetical protein [Streptomyces sp. DSM 41921]
MSEQTPSQAEGDREDEQDTQNTPTPTPSQAEGERDDTGSGDDEATR